MNAFYGPVIDRVLIDLASHMQPYFHYIRGAANGYVSSGIPVDDGVELSIH